MNIDNSQAENSYSQEISQFLLKIYTLIKKHYYVIINLVDWQNDRMYTL